jgi:hypothetical protein
MNLHFTGSLLNVVGEPFLASGQRLISGDGAPSAIARQALACARYSRAMRCLSMVRFRIAEVNLPTDGPRIGREFHIAAPRQSAACVAPNRGNGWLRHQRLGVFAIRRRRLRRPTSSRSTSGRAEKTAEAENVGTIKCYVRCSRTDMSDIARPSPTDHLRSNELRTVPPRARVAASEGLDEGVPAANQYEARAKALIAMANACRFDDLRMKFVTLARQYERLAGHVRRYQDDA